jgi:hypothetical protein
MAVNVLSWKKAIGQGLHPGLYRYDEVPTGEYAAVLDFKIWAKKLMAINCYFTQAETGMKIQMTVYCKEAGEYKLEGSEIDFATCPVHRCYHIKVVANQKKKMIFAGALLLY